MTTRYPGRGLHGQTVEAIAGRVLGGTMPEGRPIDVEGLRAELGVSLGAVREALRVLAAKGLVDARQKRGTFVRPRADWHLLDPDVVRWHFAGHVDPALLDDLQEARGIVEPAAARLAAQRRDDDDDLTALGEALDAMASAGSRVALAVAADLAFHRALLAAAHNEMLARMAVVTSTGLAGRDRLVHRALPGADPVPSHRQVVEAIRAGNPAAADEAMRRLLDEAARDLSNTRGDTQGGIQGETRGGT